MDTDELNQRLPEEVSYDNKNNEFTITVPENTERAIELHHTNPIFREVIDTDILKLNKMCGVETIEQWQRIGFMYSRAGETFTVSGPMIGITQ